MGGKTKRILSLLLSFGLLFQQVSFAQVAAELNFASHLSRIGSNIVQDKFRPLHLRYFSYDSLNDNFKILLDKGDLKNLKASEFENSTKTLLSYFLIGVTLPDEMFWVNLRPDSEDQIIDPYLEKTNIGKIMLEADLQLKKDTAAMTSPATPEGKEYWERLYKKAAELYGYGNVTIPTLTRPWIVPGEIIVRESKDSAYVYKATLKVMLEQDYLKDSATYNFKDERSKALNEYSSQLIRELIIPKLTKEVNSSKRYAALRQVYYSLILSRWFKLRFTGKAGTYASLINTRNLTNLTSQEPWTKTTYFKQYQKSFQDGEYNIKEPVYTPTGQVIRSYFSGGINVASRAINTQNGITLPNDNTNKLGDIVGGKAIINPQGLTLRPVTVDTSITISNTKLSSSPVKEDNSVPTFVTLMVNKDLQGLNFKDVEKAITSGKMAIAEVSVDWAKKIKETYPNDVYSIFLSPLSEEQIRDRMQNEGQTREEVIFNEMRERQRERAVEKPTDEEKQLARAQAAIKEMARQNEYDIVIVSGQLKDLERDNIRWAGEEGAKVVSQFMNAVSNARKAGKKLILYSGPSATGKSPLWNQVQQRYGDQFSRIILYTTRKMRPGEQEGVDYYFRSVEQLKDLEKDSSASSPVKSSENDLYIPSSIDEAYDAVIATLTKIRGTEKTHGFPIFVSKIDKSKVEQALLTRKITGIGSVVLGYDAGDYSSEYPVTVNFNEGVIVLGEDYYSDTTRYKLMRPFYEGWVRIQLFNIFNSLDWIRKNVPLSPSEKEIFDSVVEFHALAGPGTDDIQYQQEEAYLELQDAYDAVCAKIKLAQDARINEIINWVKSDPEKNLKGEIVRVFDRIGQEATVRGSIDLGIAERFGFIYEIASAPIQSVPTSTQTERSASNSMRRFNESRIREDLFIILHHLDWARNTVLSKDEKITIDGVEKGNWLAGPGTGDDNYMEEPSYLSLKNAYDKAIEKIRSATDARITEIIEWVKSDPEKNLTGEEVHVLGLPVVQVGIGPEVRTISIDRGIAEKFGFPYETASSSIQSVPEKTGGIDFRILPMAIQPMGSFSGLNFKLPQLSRTELEKINVAVEIQQIKSMVQAGIIPSAERIKELVAACVQKKEINSQLDSLLLCLADIFKLEEENASESSPELKEALVIVDSES